MYEYHILHQLFLQCVASSGVGSLLDVTVIVGGQEGSLAGVQSYDAPELSGVDPGSGDTVGGSSTTVSGENLGVFDSSLKARFGGSACASGVGCLTAACCARLLPALVGVWMWL